MTRRLPRLWRALEALPQRQTERRDWQLRLGDEWPAAERLLRSTGRVVDAIDCPAPGSDGCPRRVVRHNDGRIVAVCGNSPRLCDAVDLAPADIEVLELDERTLRKAIGSAAGLGEASARVPPGKLELVGMVPVRAGLGIPIMVGFPTPDSPIAAHDVPTVPAGFAPGVVLTPTGALVSGLPDGWSSLPLNEVLSADGHDRIVMDDSGTAAFAELSAGVAEADKRASGVVWWLPADARWEDMLFEFLADENVSVSFRRQRRSFEPVDIGLRNEKNKRPSSLWALLYEFAQRSGQYDLGGQTIPAKFQKRKENLSKALRRSFGIADDPIPWRNNEHAFVCRFLIRDSIPVAAKRRAGREDGLSPSKFR